VNERIAIVFLLFSYFVFFCLGAFGKVFLCYDVDTGSELAIKQIPIRGLNSETSRVFYTANINNRECFCFLLAGSENSRM